MVVAVHAGQGAEKIPAAVDRRRGRRAEFSSWSRVQKMARSAPVLKPSGSNRAPWSWLPSRQTRRVLDHQVEALARIGAVADNVAQAEDLVDALAADVGKHRLESLQVAVDVADDGPFQDAAGLGESWKTRTNQ